MSRRIIAQYVADGMVLSPANIYFTTHDDGGARVFRTAQSATLGQEIELCYEPACRFGDIVFANVDGVFYGYFFALVGGMTTIRRIQLDQQGQVAEIIGPTPPVTDIDIVSSHSNLVTDGSFLYWQSDTAINKMPIQGGTVTNLDTTPLTRPVTGLHLVGPNLIYAVDRVGYYVRADGSSITNPALRVVFTADAGVLACAPQGEDLIVVADRNGGIVTYYPNGSSLVIQGPGAAFITSVGGSGGAGWTQMAATWELRIQAGVNFSTSFTFATGANPRLLSGDLTGVSVYCLDDDGVVAYDLNL